MQYMTYLQYRGRIQVGVGEARSREKKSSESVHVAGPRGPADPADPTPSRPYDRPTFCTQILQRDQLVFRFIIAQFPVSQKTIDLATQGPITVVVHVPPEHGGTFSVLILYFT